MIVHGNSVFGNFINEKPTTKPTFALNRQVAARIRIQIQK